MTSPIDPESLNTWEDAFQYPIPRVRQLERQLRNDLAGNRDKLRSLVSDSYRDLLQTAHRIIEMDQEAVKVEQHLADASRNCNSRVLDRKARNLRTFYETSGKGDREKYAYAAQLAVLQWCPHVIARLMHKDGGESCLLAAKVFVISRLLAKSFPEKGSIPLVTTLRDQLGILRPTILRHVDSLLSSADIEVGTLVSTMTAYSVLKTASSTEVLRYFLQLRATSIASTRDQGTSRIDAIVESMDLLNKTLADTDAIFPRKLAGALLALKAKSLLQDPEVESLPELGLDVNGKWLPEDVKGFIPWVKHDDLEATKVTEMMKTWVAKEVGKLRESLRRLVAGLGGINELVKLRDSLLASWRAGSRSRVKYLGDESEELRKIIMGRFNTVSRQQVEALDAVADKVKALIPEAGREDKDITSLWSSSLLKMDLNHGALNFRNAVSSRVHGKNGAVKEFLDAYKSYAETVENTSDIIQGIRVTAEKRPTDHDDDDFELEEQIYEEGVADSASAEAALLEALESAYKNFEERIGELAKEELVQSSVKTAAFLIRVIRHTRKNPVSREGQVLLQLPWFGTRTVTSLHTHLAAEVAKRPLDNLQPKFQERKLWLPVASKPLWEGEPPLPALPSHQVFQFLSELVSEMSSVGEDIWTANAVKTIKAYTCDNLWRIFAPELDGLSLYDPEAAVTDNPSDKPAEPENPEVDKDPETSVADATSNERPNGVTEAQSTEGNEGEEVTPALTEAQTSSPSTAAEKNITRDWIYQLLFDALYLDEVLHRRRRRGHNGVGSVASLAAKVDDALGKVWHVEEEKRKRLEGGASEHWKKTGLLFGLLNS